MSSEVESKADFNLIRYAQCWEDADILLAGLNINEGDVCLSIASAGDNALAMLCANPKKVIAIDLSDAQLHCVALRVAAYRHLSHEQLLQLIGSRPCDNRKSLIDLCKPSLEIETIQFWESIIDEVEKYGLGGVGKFERYFRLFKDRVLPLVHSKKTVNELLEDKPPALRKDFYDNRWNSLRWRLLLKLFFSRYAMGKLGRDPSFFEYVDSSVAEHVAGRTAHALTQLNPADNPYLQWILTGTHTTALPYSLRPENFEKIRANIDRLEWRREPLEDFTKSGQKVDAFNLSDIFEYMSIDSFNDLYQKITETANSGARIAYWNMMAPRWAKGDIANNVSHNKQASEELFHQDKAFFYARFIVEVVK